MCRSEIPLLLKFLFGVVRFSADIAIGYINGKGEEEKITKKEHIYNSRQEEEGEETLYLW